MNGRTLGVSLGLVALVSTAVLVAGQHNQFASQPPKVATANDQAGQQNAGESLRGTCCQDGGSNAASTTCCQDGAGKVPDASTCCETGECAGCEACADEQAVDPAEAPSAAGVGQQRGRRGPPAGRGPGRGRGFQRGGGQGEASRGGNDQFQEDHNVFFYLLDHRDAITRTITNLDDGIETVTESDDPDVTAKIQEHVAAMYDRIENVNPIHMRDPLFRELFANTDRIHMEMTDTAKGIRVKETSTDPYVARLLQEHAKTVSLFIENGREELHKNHALPQKSVPDDSVPIIKGHGKVVQLPGAAAQPRDGSKLCIDITTDGPHSEINSAIDKVARFVNIYAAGGDQPATAEFTVVLHGDATVTTLNDEAYAARFDTPGNPNLPLIRSLEEAGVEFFVCGQALSSKDVSADEVAEMITVSVSALTVNVNRQQDGYVPIRLD